MDALGHFHPAVTAWFRSRFPSPTAAQTQAWPAIQSGHHTLIAAPTGSGKTLAAFLSAIDALVRLGVRDELPGATQVVYISPLKALSNDIQRNLEDPLAGIREHLAQQGLRDVAIRTQVRTGDTPQAERARMRRNPPHILVTTPESLYILVTSESGRRMLATTSSVIVDEIHALVQTKRGAHLALTLERLEQLCPHPITRIGLSATQKPIGSVANFLVGNPQRISKGLIGTGTRCQIIDTGHVRERDLSLELPDSPLEAVMSAEMWGQVHDRLVQLIQTHRSTLIFVNTRRLAERLARALTGQLGKESVMSHHGSLAKDQRFDAEQRLKRGELKALVATSSLELGIDVGYVDLVCQIASPRALSAFLQRVGRSGHAVGGLPKGRLFPLTRDDLMECTALIDAVHRGELDELRLCEKPMDVLAQQIAAEVACQEWDEDALFTAYRQAWPYRDLQRAEFDAVTKMLAEGISTQRGRAHTLVHRDGVHKQLRPRQGVRLTAITCGGTIPDTADYVVVLQPEETVIGSVNEDFAIESMAGDVFQLGNRSYRILRVEAGRVRVADAQDVPPTIPFWLGEAPGRTDEVSQSVSRLRQQLNKLLDDGENAAARLEADLGLRQDAARQLADYLQSAHAALGALPTQDHIFFERFFDEAGGMQLVIHSCFGSRLNRAWGLALRKRFCRKFNFELQAAATEDAIILSLTAVHSFALEEVARYLHSSSVRAVLVQALLDAPMFITRWRWNASIALALLRQRGGERVPTQLQRMQAEDLIATVFPDQLACLENIAGEREIPDHPLVNQTISDCLHEAMDVAGLERLLRRIEEGDVRITGRDLAMPSPMAAEILAAKPYAFLDDAPLEERRTQAVVNRRWLDPQSAADIGRLDPQAIARVREEAWPDAQSADELHDALLWLGFLTDEEVQRQTPWIPLLEELARKRRVAQILLPTAPRALWCSTERLAQILCIHPESRVGQGAGEIPAELNQSWAPEAATTELVRGRLEGLGPVTASVLAQSLGVAEARTDSALLALEAEGFALRGHFTGAANALEWCERRLLARIHRYTLKRLRQEIEPVSAADFMRFLLRWQRVGPAHRMEGPDGLAAVLSQLEGFEAAAIAWESELLPARLAHYEPTWLDDLCRAGRVVWTRLNPPAGAASRSRGPVRSSPITLLNRQHAHLWAFLGSQEDDSSAKLSSNARAVLEHLRTSGASFFDDIAHDIGLPKSFVEEALGELVTRGWVRADSFAGLRALLMPSDRRKPFGSHGRGRHSVMGIEDAGRWAAASAARKQPDKPSGLIEHVARALLKRYGIVFWHMLAREADWLPPWRELMMCFRRLEARGEIRGGRFVAGFSGEQFALPEAISALRRTDRAEDELLCLSGADPLNLAGTLVPGPKVPALAGNRIILAAGIPVAALVAGEVQYMQACDPAKAARWREALFRHPANLRGTDIQSA
ncbi:MAG: DEAD/DEAH box helicase [Betaproteobacteria bacterium]|nr:DEAD/DEAH box helicase [Betaproteobacteria bacterium]